MTCSRCRKNIRTEVQRCPHCGERNPASSGTFQTSTVLISTAGADRVYRSVAEVPPGLRTRLLKSTNGSNSATILIADRRGRKEIARAMRKMPGSRQRRLAGALLADAPQRVAWLTPRRRAALLSAIVLSLATLIALLFTHRWN